MRFNDLNRLLRSHGHTLARTSPTYRIFRNARGQVPTISGDDGRKKYSCAEMAAIRREMRRHQQQSKETPA